MKCERAEVLNNYLKSEKFKEITGLSDEEIEKIDIRDKEPELLVAAIKKLIISYCNEDSEVVVLRNINTAINS